MALADPAVMVGSDGIMNHGEGHPRAAGAFPRVYAQFVRTGKLSLYEAVADIQKNCRPDDVRIQDGIALVAAVGRKMTSRPGTSGRLFQALGQHGLNIRTIAQGADELSIIVGVENSDFEKAIRVLYDGFTG